MRNGSTPLKSSNWRNFSLSVHSNIYKRKQIKSIFGTKPQPIATDSPSKILNIGIAEASKKLQELSDRAKKVKTTVPKRNVTSEKKLDSWKIDHMNSLIISNCQSLCSKLAHLILENPTYNRKERLYTSPESKTKLIWLESELFTLNIKMAKKNSYVEIRKLKRRELSQVGNETYLVTKQGKEEVLASFANLFKEHKGIIIIIREVINACTPNSQGELRFREISDYCSSPDHKIQRIWCNSMHSRDITLGILHMVPQDKINPFYFHALSRQYVDLLYEANFTIIFQQYIKGKYAITRMLMCTLMSMGQLQYDKELKNCYEAKLKIEIGNEFYPITYIDKMNDYLEFNYGEDSRKFPTEAEGLQFIADTSLLQSCEVVKIKTSKVEELPKLYNFVNLSNEIRKKLKLSLSDTVNILKKLYMKGLISYPFTACETVHSEKKHDIKQLLEIFCVGLFGNYDQKHFHFPDSTFSSEHSLTGHHAIIPLELLPLPKQPKEHTIEEKVYGLILGRFLRRSTKNKRKKEVVNIIFNNNGHAFEGEIEHIEKDSNEFWPHLIQIDNTPLSKQLEGIKVGSIVPCELPLTIEKPNSVGPYITDWDIFQLWKDFVEIEDNIDYTIQLRDCGWFETGPTVPQNEYHPIPLSAKIVEDMKKFNPLTFLTWEHAIQKTNTEEEYKSLKVNLETLLLKYRKEIPRVTLSNIS